MCLNFDNYLVLWVMQGGLQQSLDNSTIFGGAIVGLLSGAGCIYHIERTRGLTQGEWLQLRRRKKIHYFFRVFCYSCDLSNSLKPFCRNLPC
jgi:hypothetical protein